MKHTGIFSLIGNMPLETSNNQVQDDLTNMSNQIVETLHNLCLRNAITTEQYEKMMYYNQSTIFKMNKLYFVPEIRNNEIIIQQMTTCFTDEPINAISCFAHNLLQPLTHFIVHTSYTFPSAGNTIEALEQNAQKGSLRSTTLFVKIDIHVL
ncbi:unnamed protein product [Rotaria sordida]|uniref:Uncharacterized protein n=1 Tax=Rotaria sordida TaxID=392033 RepID=A0A815HFH2_9BILA|nr:unnamed protein product [Rotaria sordida]CAF1418142.1 unnamed protein product [Rotaria sordida]CAF4136178.1 unnamed protein product [Rotaria sordida]